jgi:hypothetical protein
MLGMDFIHTQHSGSYQLQVGAQRIQTQNEDSI